MVKIYFLNTNVVSPSSQSQGVFSTASARWRDDALGDDDSRHGREDTTCAPAVQHATTPAVRFCTMFPKDIGLEMIKQKEAPSNLLIPFFKSYTNVTWDHKPTVVNMSSFSTYPP